MTCQIFESARLHGSVQVPPAKEEVLRALLLSALGQGSCRIHGLASPLCKEAGNMAQGIAAVGAKASWEGDVLRVEPGPQGPGQGEEPFRALALSPVWPLLLPALWVRGREAALTLEEEPEPPALLELENLSRQAGCGVTLGQDSEPPLQIEVYGKLNAGEYQVDSSLGDPLLSGLLMALSHATDGEGKAAPSRLTVTGPMACRAQVDTALEWMRRFGRSYEEKEAGVFTLSPSQERGPEDVKLAGDWVQGAALLCANALGSGVRVENLRGGSRELGPQREARILDLLGQMGLSVFGNREEWYVTSPSRARLLPLRADCGDVLEVAPLLALLCTQACGESILSGIRGSREAEDTLPEATVELLTRMGARAGLSEEGDALVIHGPTRLRGGLEADAGGDARIVLLAAFAALVAQGPLAVSGAEVLDESWPGFLAAYQALGGNVSQR
ncbi:MAG: hypothetical protein VB099_16960 [Candidatus Limiplasma sp.]|nr:hypothetical protein [Candidatus Limiplasma sp.]